MNREFQPLTDLQWQLLEPLFPMPIKRSRGKPHTPWRPVLNSIFWVLHSGGKWSSIPKTAEFASKSAVHRWFLIWEKTGFLREVLLKYELFAEPANIVSPPRRRRERKPCEAPPVEEPQSLALAY